MPRPLRPSPTSTRNDQRVQPVESEKQHPQHEVGSAESHMPDSIGAQPGADGWELELKRSLL